MVWILVSIGSENRRRWRVGQVAEKDLAVLIARDHAQHKGNRNRREAAARRTRE
jgi:hypothetical protein